MKQAVLKGVAIGSELADFMMVFIYHHIIFILSYKLIVRFYIFRFPLRIGVKLHSRMEMKLSELE